MYLKNVNRGMSFTKAGVYTTGLVLLLGLLATSSGSNAFFIALGFGLSLLTISGLLSERSMKYLVFDHLGSIEAEAQKPFSVGLTMSNRSPSWFLFGVESLLLTELPRFRLFNAKLKAPIEARLLSLGPLQTTEVSAQSQGLPRGIYEEFYVVQRTLFPFGLISKFKVSQARTSLSVLPVMNSLAAETLNQEIARRFYGHLKEEEFHSHRPMTYRDPRRNVDWKKNAGRPVHQWVVRTYHSTGTQTQVHLRVNWDALRSSSSETDYEEALSLIRTASEVIFRAGLTAWLELEDRTFLNSLDSIKDSLMRAPTFARRQMLKSPSSGQVGRFQNAPVLVLDGIRFSWEGH